MRISSSVLFSEARKAEDPTGLPSILQSLGNPGTSYAEQCKFPLIFNTTDART